LENPKSGSLSWGFGSASGVNRREVEDTMDAIFKFRVEEKRTVVLMRGRYGRYGRKTVSEWE